MYHKRFSGTHYQAGYRFGSMLKKYGVMIDKSPVFDITEEMKRFSADCMKEYERYYPEILEEIRGMAEGQGSSFQQLCWILFCMYCFETEPHCTCFAVADEENVILGRNSDFLVSLEELNMNCLYRLDGAYAFNGNTTAFIEMEDGMNEHGLAIGLTFVYPRIQKPGINAGMLVRYILEKCKTTAEAVERLKELPVASAQTLAIADSGGKIAVIECNAQAMEILYPEGGKNYVAATNHFHAECLRQFDPPETVDDWRSEDRYKTVKTALETCKGRYSVGVAQRVLAGGYGFICQYDRKKNADTVWSAVYDVKNRKVYRAEGNPSRKRFQEDGRMPFAAVLQKTAEE